MTTTTPLFLYGTLCDLQQLKIVAGRGFPFRPARLEGHAVYRAKDQSFPILETDQGAVADGILIHADENALARLDFYELGFGYHTRTENVAIEDGPVEALVYFPEPGRWEVGEPWSLDDWQRDHGALARNAAEEYMRLFGVLSPDEAAQTFRQVRARAASRLRAMTEPSPSALSPHMSGQAVTVRASRQPYTDYFAVREDDLSFPHFDGSESSVVTRAAFMGGDAVTILPYDPKTDCVLVVRQFRYGAFVRSDPNPWCIEPVAGRIDPGETPDVAALRELAEESRVEAKELHRFAEYYPSPAAYSEYLISYVAIADLSGADGHVCGLDDEAEDIMTHVLPFDAAMDTIASGAANTGPLVLSLLWLAANRSRFRTGD